MKSLISFILLTSSAFSQDAYVIPFASKGNTIELTVSNSSVIPAHQVSVEVAGAPSWLVFDQKSVAIDQIKGKQEQSAMLSFSVDKRAVVNKEESMDFTVRSNSEETWTKQIRIKVAPPERFELFQNYPNPFNPTTAISYQLSADSKVTLKIYNVIGQEVATLVDEQKQAGYHQEMFDASRYASGMYIYRIIHTNASGKQASDRKTMLLLK